MISIKRAVRWATLFLRHLETPRLESEVLLSEILKKDRVFLKSHNEERISLFCCIKYIWWILKRKHGSPLAQIIGYKTWGEMRLFVNKHVLIPRDETEVLCEKITEEKRSFDPKTIIDIGTGSGAIALYLGQFFDSANIVGVDLSEKALQVAKKNASTYTPRLKLFHSDLLSVFSQQSRFDILVANLPYVPENMKVSAEVQKEPRLALYSGDDGLDHYRRLAKQLRSKKIVFKELWIEFLPFQKNNIMTIFSDWQVNYKEDISGEIFFAKISPIPL